MNGHSEPNGALATEERPATLDRIFAASASRDRQAVALVAEDGSLTYGELEKRVQSVARALCRRVGAKSLPPDSLVGLHARRSSDLVVGMLAILSAGGAYVPLEPSYPMERLRYLVDDSALEAVLSDDAAAAEQLGMPAERVVLIEQQEFEAGEPIAAAASPEDLAYVIYTSGSSGKPKGVAVPHRGVCNMALSHRELLRIEPGDRVLFYSSIAFDASLAEIFPALAGGATIFVAGEEVRRAPDALFAYLREQRITVATLMASVMGALPRDPLPDLRSLLLAGETPTRETMAFWSEGRRLFNAYGPTEASVSSCAHLYQSGDPPNRIGRPLPETLLYVLDEEGTEVPVGGTGELCIGGVGVARGYLGRPELTARNFLDNPFAPGRLYRSGDLVRRVAPDTLDYVGRRDFQVKIGGIRIEPDEVAQAIDALPGVRQSCVLALGQGEAKALTACYVAEAPAPDEERLREALAEQLPAAMIPGRFLAFDALPLNNSGKVDRTELARLAEAKNRRSTPPLTTTEREVAELWQEALRLPRVGREDNFYALGGDSLRLNWLLQRLNQRYALRLVANRFRKFATLADLAEYIDRERASASVEEF